MSNISSREDSTLSLASPIINIEIPDGGELFLEYGEKRRYQQKEIIIDYGDNVNQLLFLHRGQVKMSSYTLGGVEKIIWYMNAPAVFAETLLFHGKSSKTVISASEPSDVYSIDKVVLARLQQTHAQINQFIIKIMAQKIRVLTSQIEDLSVNDPQFRVAKLLYMLGKQNGVKEGSTYVINLRLTHQDIANITGLHRVTISNIIKLFSLQKIIEKEKDKLIIYDINALALYFSDSH